MAEIIIPILALGVLGVLFGVGLALAAKKFYVTTDPRIEQIVSYLPGVNCGACGMAGCMGFAEALVQGVSVLESCVGTQEESRISISKIMGIEVRSKIKNVAVLHCNGGSLRAKNKYIYQGVKDCISANQVLGGQKLCGYGCIGYGTCAKICPFGAIEMSGEDLPVVIEEKCKACGKCVEACPKKLFSLAPVSKNFLIRCKSLDLGKKVMNVCSVGCIACRKCEKACPVKAISVVDNLAVIDYNKCGNYGECFNVCPNKTIAKKDKYIWVDRN